MENAPAVDAERTAVRKPIAAAWLPAALRRWLATRGRTVLLAAVCAIVLQLVVRGWVVANGFFYWDDLILVGRAGTYPLWSADLLLYDHDGHFMPLAFAVAWLVTALAPLEWGVAAAVSLLAQAIASFAVLRLLLVLLGRRRALLVPLLFYLFVPLTLSAFAWWSAALNALPLQAALAWVTADAILLDRTGRRRYTVSGIVVFLLALLFFEKAIVVPFVALAVVLLRRCVDGRGIAAGAVLRRGMRLWAGSALVLAVWALVYCAVTGFSPGDGDRADPGELLPRTEWAGVLTAVFGGPWGWERWVPAAPWAVPPDWTVWAAWALLAAVVIGTIVARPIVWTVWAAAGVYISVVQVPVVFMRAGPNTVDELMMSLRYLADTAVVLTIAGVLLLRAFAIRRGRSGNTGDRHPWWRGPVPVVLLVAGVTVSSLWSTYTFTRSWSQGPTRGYVTTVQSEFERWDGIPLLEQEVPWEVLNPTAYPQNEASRVLSSVAPPGAFASSTEQLRMITDAGEFADARVWWNRGVVPGPDPGCGHRIDSGGPVRVALDGPMLAHEWTAQLNYIADRDGEITVGFERGHKVTVPVRAGMHTVFVRIVGSGSALLLQGRTPGSQVCLGTGPVGVAAYDR